jgi:hypothetical protein
VPPAPSPAPAGPPAFATFARELVERRKVFASNAHHLDLTSLLETHLIPFFGDDRLMSEFAIEDVGRFVAHMNLTKTPGSARSVDLRPQVVRALKEQKTSSRLKSDFVFCSSVGGPLNRDNLMNRVWYPALKRAGIRERKPCQTRHTFATALSAGEAIGWMSKQMGHSNTKMIIEHYYRFIPNLTRQDGSAFEKAAAQVGL